MYSIEEKINRSDLSYSPSQCNIGRQVLVPRTATLRNIPYHKWYEKHREVLDYFVYVYTSNLVAFNANTSQYIVKLDHAKFSRDLLQWIYQSSYNKEK